MNISEYNASLFEEAFREKKAWKAQAASPAQIIQPDWWTQFGDPYLDYLIGEAVSHSFDLKIALRRIQEAGLNIKDAKARLMPSVSSSSSASFSQYTQQIPDVSDIRNLTDTKMLLERLNSQYFNTGMNISWELDLWGKKKREYLVSTAGYEESKALYRAEYLKVVSELAQSYFELRQKDREIEIADKLREDHLKRLAIYQNQYAEGIIPEWKVLRQKAELENARKELADLEQNRKSVENRIASYLGKPAGEFSIPKAETREFMQIVRVPAGLPAELLSRRPDIIAAKYRVIKSYHQSEESKLTWLPTVSLTGNGGLASSAVSALLRQWTLGFTPNISFPVFDGGSSKNRSDISQLQLANAEDEYRKTVMKAFEEIENTLITLHGQTRQKEILEEKRLTMKRIQEQTRAKFEKGLISQLEVSDIDRELYSTEKSLIAAHRSLSDNTVTLFKALGGGWSEISYKVELSKLVIIEAEK
jgi:NodT family efflux transporter outer membrane factor (OMF) lipoprotein